MEVDGQPCRDRSNNIKGNLDASFHGAGPNMHRPMYIRGICYRTASVARIAAGNHAVRWRQTYTSGDSYWGWNSNARLMVEVRPWTDACWRWEVGRGGGGDRRRKEDVRGSWGEGWFRWCNVSAARGRWSNAEPSRVCHLVVSCTFRAGMGPVNVWGAFGVLGNILRRLEAPVSPETPPTCQELARSRCLLHPRASGLLYI